MVAAFTLPICPSRTDKTSPFTPPPGSSHPPPVAAIGAPPFRLQNLVTDDAVLEMWHCPSPIGPWLELRRPSPPAYFSSPRNQRPTTRSVSTQSGLRNTSGLRTCVKNACLIHARSGVGNTQGRKFGHRLPCRVKSIGCPARHVLPSVRGSRTFGTAQRNQQELLCFSQDYS
jgi:hypothetical protein